MFVNGTADLFPLRGFDDPAAMDTEEGIDAAMAAGAFNEGEFTDDFAYMGPVSDVASDTNMPDFPSQFYAPRDDGQRLGGLFHSIRNAVANVTSALAPVAAPVNRVVAPIMAPVQRALAPVAAPIARNLPGPVQQIVGASAPLLQSVAPIDPMASTVANQVVTQQQQNNPIPQLQSTIVVQDPAPSPVASTPTPPPQQGVYSPPAGPSPTVPTNPASTPAGGQPLPPSWFWNDQQGDAGGSAGLPADTTTPKPATSGGGKLLLAALAAVAALKG